VSISPPPPTNPLVAVINDSPELINMLGTWFEAHDLRVVCANLGDFRRGHEDIETFIDQHRPAVIVFDIGMPYHPNWDFLCVLRLLPGVARVPIVATTANKLALEAKVGSTDAHEIVGNADDLNRLTMAVRAAAAAAPASPVARQPAST
jgi:CheY-like chemotaxis protein